MSYAICTSYVVPPQVVVTTQGVLGLLDRATQLELGVETALFPTEEEAQNVLNKIIDNLTGEAAWLADPKKWVVIPTEQP